MESGQNVGTQTMINWQMQMTGNFRFQEGSIKSAYGTTVDDGPWWVANDTLSKSGSRNGNAETLDLARQEAEFAILELQTERKK